MLLLHAPLTEYHSICRHESLDADTAIPQKRPRVEDEGKDGLDAKRMHQDSEDAGDLTSKADQPKFGSDRHKRRDATEPPRTTASVKDTSRHRERSRDDRTTKEEKRAHTSRER